MFSLVLRSVFPVSNNSGRVLLIGARPSLVGYLGKMLRRVGYSVARASETSEWQHFLISCDVAILVDSTPLWSSGRIFDICSAMRYDSPGVPIMVIGPDDLKAKVRLFEVGVDDYLIDPFDDEEFLARIRALIRRRRQKS